MANRRRRRSVGKQFSPGLGGVLILVAFVAVVVGAGVIVPRLMALPNKEESAPVVDRPWQAEHPAAGASAPWVDLPELEFPSLAAPPPQFTFTDEEINSLNEMLALWAEEETFILVQPEEDEDSSSSSSSSSASSSSGSSSSQAQKKAAEPQYVADGGHDVAVWFMDVGSGAQYVYNEQFQFSYASLMKGPYAAWLYTLAQEGGCDLEEQVEVKPEDIGKYAENTGVLKTMDLPAQFSVETLIGYMLESSDTVALKLLLARYPAEGFKQWAAQQGVQDPDGLNSVVSGKVSAADMGALAMATYRVMEYGQHGASLRAHMEAAGNRMIASDHPVAHKYGWDEHAYHDMAVVHAPHPYVMVIMTDKWGGSYAEMAKFGEISRALETMMAAKWAAWEAEETG